MTTLGSSKITQGNVVERDGLSAQSETLHYISASIDTATTKWEANGQRAALVSIDLSADHSLPDRPGRTALRTFSAQGPVHAVSPSDQAVSV